MNEFLLGVQGGDVVALQPLPRRFTKEQALRLAALIVAMMDDDNEFPDYLRRATAGD